MSPISRPRKLARRRVEVAYAAAVGTARRFDRRGRGRDQMTSSMSAGEPICAL